MDEETIGGKRKGDNGTDEIYQAEHLLERVVSVLRLINESSIAPGDMLHFLYALRRRKAPSLAHLTYSSTVDFAGLSVEIPNLAAFRRHSRKLGMMKRDARERSSWVAMMLEASANTINECSVPNIRAHRSLKFGLAAGQAFGREDPLPEPNRLLYNFMNW